MRARATTVLLIFAAIALPAVMAVAVFYASDQAIGDAPGGVTPQFGANVQPITTVPPTTETEHHRRKHRDSGGTTTAGTDDHGGSTSGRSPGGSGGSGGSTSGSDDGSGSGSSGGSGGSGHGGSGIAQRLRQPLRFLVLRRGQPVRQHGDAAALAGVGGAVDARPQARRGQQALVVRGLQHGVAGAGQLGPGPQIGEVAVEVQRGAAGHARLQRVAGERVAHAGLVQREEAVPVLAPRELQQEVAAQILRWDQVRIFREVRLHRGQVGLAEVVLQRGSGQVGIERVIAQLRGVRAPAVATLLGCGPGLLERGALRRGRCGRVRADGGEQGATAEQQGRQAGGGMAPRRCLRKHANSLVIPCSGL